MPEELQPNKSTRSFKDWADALRVLIARQRELPVEEVFLTNDFERIKPYYDQGLMPDVCFKELFNR